MSVLHRNSVEPGVDPAEAILSTSPAPRDQARQAVTPSAQPARHSRLGSVWGGVWAAAVIGVLLIFFMLQGTARTRVAFLGFSGTTSLSVALLIAAVGGIVLTMVVGITRITQLRLRAGLGLRRSARSDSGRSTSHA